ncbi:uncharacterized protein LOC131680637 [Topomyia yanbarensis]|uniref:uncharacterized protein LOC131680637 n=1 Tax=Topomyia yanbarensis TaxID=2498891 RepID=UPI00273C410E|nr:uncharacterized protein LOC131680637 [Topomyia yanbarensis]
MYNDQQGNFLTDKTTVTVRWKEHFEVLLNDGSESISRNRTSIENDGQAVDPPTLDEVKNTIRDLKTGKAAGKDEIPVAILKQGGEQLHQIIHRIIRIILADEELPASWLDGPIFPFDQKGHKLECANYRWIFLLNSPYKILSRILSSRLRPLEGTRLIFVKADQRRIRCSACG